MTDFPAGHRSFFAREITEPEENSLRVVVVESTTLPDMAEVSGTNLMAYPVVVDERSPSLELLWEQYIAYAVEDESYAQHDDMEDIYPLQSMLIERRASAYLTYLRSASFASVDYPGTFSHWQLICQNHTVNVASTAPPRLTWIEGSAEYPIR